MNKYFEILEAKIETLESRCRLLEIAIGDSFIKSREDNKTNKHDSCPHCKLLNEATDELEEAVFWLFDNISNEAVEDDAVAMWPWLKSGVVNWRNRRYQNAGKVREDQGQLDQEGCVREEG